MLKRWKVCLSPKELNVQLNVQSRKLNKNVNLYLSLKFFCYIGQVNDMIC